MMPRAQVAAERVNEILDMEVMIKDPEEPKEFLPEKKGEVEFKNVYFCYPDADEAVLHNISFTAPAGKTTAFIGSTGSGKSTLINLIPRFFDVSRGSILVDGVDIRDVKQHDLCEKIGYVPQKGVLFSGTIESNLKYGKEDATIDEVKRAARIAQATDFIEEKESLYFCINLLNLFIGFSFCPGRHQSNPFGICRIHRFNINLCIWQLLPNPSCKSDQSFC